MFIPPLNTLYRKDPSNIIPDSIKNGDGVKVLSGFRGGESRKMNYQEENGQEEKL